MRSTLFHLLILPGIIYILANESPTSAVGIAQDRVLNGKPVDPPHSRPYVAQFRRPETPGTMKYLHNAIIYDEYTILTVGAYVNDGFKNYIVAGKYYSDDLKIEDSQQNRDICSVSKFIPKSEYGFDDYAAIHLSKPLVFNEYVEPISLAPPGAEVPNTTCYLIGWGETTTGGHYSYSDVLREAVVTFKPMSTCNFKEDPRLACIDQGPCHYDWGAPVVCDLNGVPTAYAYAYYTESNCNRGVGPWLPALPRDWLLNEIEIAKTKTSCSSVRPKPTPSPTPPPTPPPTSPPRPPATPPPPPPGECECRLKGYCKMYFECVNYPNNTAGWEYTGNCTGNLYWNSNDVTGGFCDYFQNLPPELQTKYRSDPTCIHCDWFQELSDVCSPRYTFRDTNLVEHKMSCPASPGGKDPLYWQLNTKSCDLCYNAVDYHGVACQCNK